MLHITEHIRSLEELHAFLEQNHTRAPFTKSILAQVFSGPCDQSWISEVCASIRAFYPGAVIIGATTSGEICKGRALNNTTVVSLSFFSYSAVELCHQTLRPGDEKLAGEFLQKKILDSPGPVRGLLLFSTPRPLNCNELIKSILDRMPDLPLFGAIASGFEKGMRPLVFCDGLVLDSGIAAVLFTGADLRISRDAFLGWTPIGNTMTATKTEGPKVLEIDGVPALDIYRKYLGISDHSTFLYDAMEFPLLYRKGNHLLATTAVYAHEDGSITYSVEIAEGEKIQFSYAHIDTITEGMGGMLDKISRFSPEAIYLYSCFTRRFLLQEDIDIEISEFDDMAPSSGFFTGGEFCNIGVVNSYLNTTIVMVSVAEGEGRPLTRKQMKQATCGDPIHLRHSRILRKFSHFLKAVTDDLVNANGELKKQMEEIRELRQIIPICSGCKKIRDDKGYWNQLETYLKTHSNIDFTHGICPECARKLYPQLYEKDFPE